MISIVVSSVNPEQYKAFRRNIEETIGVDYELLVHDNCQTGRRLCKLGKQDAASRSRLIYAPDTLDLFSILKQFGEVATFPYKFKLVRHVFRAGMERIGRRLTRTMKK